MDKDWRPARVIKVVKDVSKVRGTPILKVKLKLLEPYRIDTKRCRSVWTTFSLEDDALCRVLSFALSLELSTLGGLDTKLFKGRYCRVQLVVEDYKDVKVLRVGMSRPLNLPVAPTVESLTAAMAELRAQRQELKAAARRRDKRLS